MNAFRALVSSSLGRKFLMALTGFVLVGFVFLHMLGNLQIFLGPDILNAYAHTLQSLPLPIKWGGRLFLLVCVAIHLQLAIVLTLENRRARAQDYEAESTLQASLASRTMHWSGAVLLLFSVIHLLHFTIRVLFDYSAMPYSLHDETVHDVYAMMIVGFSHWWMSLFYVVAMVLLCSHLSHGASSMFQSMGVRNDRWRGILDWLAQIFGVVILLGFISIPTVILLCRYTALELLPVNQIVAQYEAAKAIAAVP